MKQKCRNRRQTTASNKRPLKRRPGTKDGNKNDQSRGRYLVKFTKWTDIEQTGIGWIKLVWK